MPQLKITFQRPAALKTRDRNPRTHSKKQIRQIADSITRFGFKNPVLVDADNRIIAGHGRVEAAKKLGLADVPTIRFEDMTDAEIRAYVIADNRLAELAGWDRNLLALELQDLIEMEVETNLDVTVTGFEMGEIDLMIGGLDVAEDDDPDDDIPAVNDAPPVTRPGDLWRIGPHRLLCGDAMDPEAYNRLLDREKAQLVFTDPPYNVKVDGHVSGLGKVKHREFAMASGEMNAAAFTDFLQTAFANLASASVDGAIQFICMDWRHIGEVIAAGKQAYTELKNLCIWSKTNAGMGSLYRSRHELVFVFKSGTAPHINNVSLGKYGRYRTNIWTYPGANSFGKTRDADLELHPTVKPVALVADAILDCSKRNGIVLDAFAGSGTTLLAAHRTGRRGYSIELDAHYADVIVKRVSKATGIEAVLDETGETFDQIERRRAASAAPQAKPETVVAREAS